MSTSYSPKIVTDGLVVYLDAANTKSYASGSTIWNSLVGTSTGSISGNPTFSQTVAGNIVFDGSDDVTLTAVFGVTNFNITYDYTINCLVYYNTTQNYTGNTYKNILSKRGRATLDPRTGGGVPYNMAYDSASATLGISTSDSGGNINYIYVPFQTNTWNNVTAVYSWSTSTLTTYVNMQQNSVPLTLTGTINGGEPLQIFKSSGVNNWTSGSVAQLLIYNKALSPAEVLQNFNATRNRFGV